MLHRAKYFSKNRKRFDTRSIVLSIIFGTALILTVLWEGFETIILPRRVRRRFRLTRLYYRSTWRMWSAAVHRVRGKQRRESLLSFYGPLSLLGLLALWATALIFGFALLHYGAGSAVAASSETPGFALDLYFSGTTFVTLGLGDVAPRTWGTRILTALEAGVGFSSLAIVIGYLPVIYQSFSRREVIISLLDARAGSPPTAGELLRRHAVDGTLDRLEFLLRDWEQWSAELSKAIFPIQCSRISVRSMTTNPGSVRSLQFSMRARSCWPAARDIRSIRPGSPSLLHAILLWI
jgi:hypothetical protein